jgi:hypothetical protein
VINIASNYLHFLVGMVLVFFLLTADEKSP